MLYLRNTYTSFSSLTLIIVVNVTPLLSSVIYLHSSVKEWWIIVLIPNIKIKEVTDFMATNMVI